MSAPTAQVQEGPSYAPPTLPAGWIAQWDGHRYYFVNMATRVSQWEMPTHDASTTYQEKLPGASLQQSVPGSGYDAAKMNNPNDNHGMYAPNENEKAEVASNDRSLSGNIGQFAMNQLLGGGKKPSKSNSSGGGLGALAGQLLGGSSHGGNNHSKTSASAITGTLVSSLLGGKQPNKPSNSSAPSQQSNHGGLMGTVSGLFGKSDKPNNYGYSQNGGQPGGYSGSVPPSSYQPNNPSHSQHHYSEHQGQHHQNQHYYPQNPTHPHQNFPQQPNIGQSHSAPPPSGQLHYNPSAQHNHQQNPIKQSHGHEQYQNMYDNGQAPPNYQQSNGEFHGPNHSNNPVHSGGYPQGQYANTHGGHSTQQPNNLYDSQWNTGVPAPPMGSHPGYQQSGSHGSQGGYGGH